MLKGQRRMEHGSPPPFPVVPPTRHTAGMTTDPPAVNDDGRRLSVLIDALIADAQMQRAPPDEMAAAVRYILAVLANDARGHACRFPCCPCPIMDCSRRPLMIGGGTANEGSRNAPYF